MDNIKAVYQLVNVAVTPEFSRKTRQHAAMEACSIMADNLLEVREVTNLGLKEVVESSSALIKVEAEAMKRQFEADALAVHRVAVRRARSSSAGVKP